jgi:predicted nucleic acid-binding protein
MAALSVFWDTNVLIDFLLERPFEGVAVKAIFEKAIAADIRLLTCESAITTSLYVCRGTRVVEALLIFLEHVSVVPADRTAIINALGSSFKDKEDAILYHLALHHGMKAFITRDKKDFAPYASALLPVFSPKEFMKSWK